MKRIITLLLCLMLVVSVLAGCGDEEKDNKATVAPTAQATVPSTEKATVPTTPPVSETVTENATDAPTEADTEPATENSEGGTFDMVLQGAYTDLNQVPAQDLTTVNRKYQSKAPTSGEVVAVIHTNYGDIKMRFFPEAAPMAVNNFIALAKASKYDNTIIHRIFHPQTAGISGIQGGDYTKFNGTGGESIYGTGFGYEISDFLSNTRGSVAMAHSSLPNSNGSQFYINQGDNSVLDGGYTIFGQVYEGLDVVDAIYAVECDSSDKPLTQVDVISIKITTY